MNAIKFLIDIIQQRHELLKHDESELIFQYSKLAEKELSRLQEIEKAAREYELVTTYSRDEEDLEVCAYCETGLGTPHKKDCRASVAHKNLLRALGIGLDIHF